VARREADLHRPRWRFDLGGAAPEVDPGATRSLGRLATFLDVVYALGAFHMLSYLPPVRDMSWVGTPLGLLGSLVAHGRDVWRTVMGLGITVICWFLATRRLGQLRATDLVHTAMALLQSGFVCFFVYFAICDPTLAGGPSARALQCGSLALAGALGQLGWRYARWRGLVDPAAPRRVMAEIEQSGRAETVTALLNVPLSWVGPVSWTVGWFVFPLAISYGLPWLLRAARRSPADGDEAPDG
jgi:hypothetical protein